MEQSYRNNNGSIFWNSHSIDDRRLIAVTIRAVKDKFNILTNYYNVALGFVLKSSVFPSTDNLLQPLITITTLILMPTPLFPIILVILLPASCTLYDLDLLLITSYFGAGGWRRRDSCITLSR